MSAPMKLTGGFLSGCLISLLYACKVIMSKEKRVARKSTLNTPN